MLSAKHELAWRSAYEDAVDVLVVLEGDALPHDDSVVALRNAVVPALRRSDAATVYLDLAGGLSRRELRITTDHVDGMDGLLRVRRPATNTACAYVLGRAVLEELASSTILVPQTALLPADWMINRFFINAREGAVVCLHTDPPALTHGSMSGATPSSIR
jgi:hypothetical protein